MKLEKKYYLSTEKEKIKKYGQYFTPYKIAEFMARWVSKDTEKILDPAAGNGIFGYFVKKVNPNAIVSGYEIDSEILEFFGTSEYMDVEVNDYLKTGWDKKYDAIICNPPYNRFQSIDNRHFLIEQVRNKTKIRLNGYTNQYILFLAKSLYQLKEGGKLAYIIPTEFLNSKYGIPIKEYLIKSRILKSIINIENNIFDDAVTTSCIMLIENKRNKHVEFISLSNMDEITCLDLNAEKLYEESLLIDFNDLKAEEKWLSFLKNDDHDVSAYSNLVNVKKYCRVSRGIATGANDFFVFNEEKRNKYGLDIDYFKLCLCRSSDLKTPVCSNETIKDLIKDNKNIYLLDIDSKTTISESLNRYLKEGLKNGINEKYLPKCRTPWYSMERKVPAPILISTASRGVFKVIRNLSEVNNLTTFHSVHMDEDFEDYVNILFCYFLTPIAQKILKTNKKQLGNGLSKFQPNDLNEGWMLDLKLITETDIEKILKLYDEILEDSSEEPIIKLNEIFEKYIY